MDDEPINTPPRSSLHIKPWFRFGMGIFTLNVSCFTLWFIHAQSLECLICSVLKNWSFELVFAYWCPPQNIDGETVKYFCKWHGHVDDDVFARITFRKRWWEIPTRAAFIAPVVVGGPDVCFDVSKAWDGDVKLSDPEMFSHTHKSHVKFLMVYFTIRVFSVCLLFLRTEFSKKYWIFTHLCLCNSLSVNRETDRFS